MHGRAGAATTASFAFNWSHCQRRPAPPAPHVAVSTVETVAMAFQRRSTAAPPPEIARRAAGAAHAMSPCRRGRRVPLPAAALCLAAALAASWLSAASAQDEEVAVGAGGDVQTGEAPPPAQQQIDISQVSIAITAITVEQGDDQDNPELAGQVGLHINVEPTGIEVPGVGQVCVRFDATELPCVDDISSIVVWGVADGVHGVSVWLALADGRPLTGASEAVFNFADSLVGPASLAMRATSTDYWHWVCPELHVLGAWGEETDEATGEVSTAFTRTLRPEAEDAARMRRTKARDGYMHSAAYDWRLPVDHATLARCAARMRTHDWPAHMAFVYDEFWMLPARMADVVRDTLGPDAVMLMDTWIHHVTNDEARLAAGHAESRGWAPHRDRPWHHLHTGAGEPTDGPLSLNVWIPLTEAAADNGCIHIVPKSRDPAFETPDGERSEFSQVGALPGLDQVELQNIRALPATPGQFLAWDGEIVHWGGMAHAEARAPRVSVSLDFAASEAAAQMLMPSPKSVIPLGFFPSMAVRLAVAAESAAAFQVHGDGLPDASKSFMLEELGPIAVALGY